MGDAGELARDLSGPTRACSSRSARRSRRGVYDDGLTTDERASCAGYSAGRTKAGSSSVSNPRAWIDYLDTGISNKAAGRH
jgi:hypothetical protein